MEYYHLFTNVEPEAQRGEATGLEVPGSSPGNLASDPEFLTTMPSVQPEDPDG